MKSFPRPSYLANSIMVSPVALSDDDTRGTALLRADGMLVKAFAVGRRARKAAVFMFMLFVFQVCWIL